MPHNLDDDEMQETFLATLKKYGLATAAAVVFGYLLIVDVRADQRQMIDQHAALLSQLIAIVEEQKNLGRGVLKTADKNGETQMLQEKILGVIKVMCVQGAATAQDRRDCLREQP